MTLLFKYMQKRHALLLLNQGKLRVGTLYEFRDTEAHGGVVGDDGEGKKSLFLDGRGETWTPNTIPAFAKTFFDLGSEGSITLEGIRLELPQDSSDYFAFCVTTEFSERALKDFGYDACVEINNPGAFFSAISHTLRHKGKLDGVFHCQYTDRNVPYDNDHGIHPALIKDPKYKEQKEVRALWKPHKSHISPIIIQNRKIAKYCSPRYEL